MRRNALYKSDLSPVDDYSRLKLAFQAIDHVLNRLCRHADGTLLSKCRVVGAKQHLFLLEQTVCDHRRFLGKDIESGSTKLAVFLCVAQDIFINDAASGAIDDKRSTLELYQFCSAHHSDRFRCGGKVQA